MNFCVKIKIKIATVAIIVTYALYYDVSCNVVTCAPFYDVSCNVVTCASYCDVIGNVVTSAPCYNKRVNVVLYWYVLQQVIYSSLVYKIFLPYK